MPLIDGEIVVLNEAGTPDFSRLQNAIDNSRSKNIVDFLSDLPFSATWSCAGFPAPAAVRCSRRSWRAAPTAAPRACASAKPPAQLLEAACQMDLEGVMLSAPTA